MDSEIKTTPRMIYTWISNLPILMTYELMSTTMLKGKAYDNFSDSISNPKTKIEYTRLLLYYCQWKKAKSLQELLTDDPVKIKEDIKKYFKYLKEDKGLAAGSRAGAAASLKHFFSMNDISLDWYQLNKFVGSDETRPEDKPYTAEQIAKVLSVADLKYKAMIYLMVSSGIRVGAIPDLKYGDLIKMKGHEIYKVIVYRRSKEEYYSFTTPEAYRAIKEYLDFRERSGEILTPKSPLFRLDFDPRDRDQVKKSTALSYQAIKSKLRHLLLRANVITEQKISDANLIGRRRNEIKMSHGFRKFAITEMGRSRMDSEIREYLVGHKLGVTGLYLKYSEEDRLKEYLRAVDNLTINAENRLLAQVDEYKKQELEIANLKKELAAYQDQAKEIQDNFKSFKEARDYILNIAKDAKDESLNKQVNNDIFRSISRFTDSRDEKRPEKKTLK